jgi:hypothetical protein
MFKFPSKHIAMNHEAILRKLPELLPGFTWIRFYLIRPYDLSEYVNQQTRSEALRHKGQDVTMDSSLGLCE